MSNNTTVFTNLVTSVSKPLKVCFSSLVIGFAMAGTVSATVTNVFTPSTPASAAEVNQNFSELDVRVTAIETAPATTASTAQTVVTVDCSATPDFFLAPPYTDTSSLNTSYDITGTCDGPLVIKDDGVILNGAPASSIALPAGSDFTSILPIEFLVAVYVDGAHGVVINDLTIDALATNLSLFDDQSVGAIHVDNGSAVLNNVAAIGGPLVAAAFNNGSIRTTGTSSFNDYFNAALSASDQGSIITDGPVTLAEATSGVGSFSSSVIASNNSFIDIRDAITISSGGLDDAVVAIEQSHVLIRNGGNATLTGSVFAAGSSRIQLNDLSVSGSIFAELNADIELNDVQQIGALELINIDESRMRVSDALSSFDAPIEVSGGSTLNLGESTATETITVAQGSYLRASNAALATVNVDNSRADLSDLTMGSISAFDGSSMSIRGISNSITGSIAITNGSSTRIANSTIASTIAVDSGSTLNLDSVTHTSTTMSVTRATVTASNSTIGNAQVDYGSNVQINAGSIGGATLRNGSTMEMANASTTGNISLFSSGLTATGDGTTAGGSLNGNEVFLCRNEFRTVIEGVDVFDLLSTTPTDLAGSGIISDTCSDGSSPPPAFGGGNL